MDGEAAAEISVAALGYMAARPELIERFLSLVGIAPDRLRAAAASPDFLAGVLEFMCSHESELLAFSVEAGIPPEAVVTAQRVLTGGQRPSEG